MSKQALKRVRRGLGMAVNRNPLEGFAWPGSYPMVYVFSDGGCCCPKCANRNIDEIDGAMRGLGHRNSHGGWALGAVDVNWEDESLACDHCGQPIPSAYGDGETYGEG